MTTLGKLTELWNILIFHWVPSCKQTDSLLLKMVIEIVDLPINSRVIFPSVFCMFTRSGINFLGPMWAHRCPATSNSLMSSSTLATRSKVDLGHPKTRQPWSDIGCRPVDRKKKKSVWSCKTVVLPRILRFFDWGFVSRTSIEFVGSFVEGSS